MMMTLTTGKNEEGLRQAEGTSQGLLQGEGHLHEGSPQVSVAHLQQGRDRLSSLTGTGWLPDFR